MIRSTHEFIFSALFLSRFSVDELITSNMIADEIIYIKIYQMMQEWFSQDDAGNNVLTRILFRFLNSFQTFFRSNHLWLEIETATLSIPLEQLVIPLRKLRKVVGFIIVYYKDNKYLS